MAEPIRTAITRANREAAREYDPSLHLHSPRGSDFRYLCEAFARHREKAVEAERAKIVAFIRGELLEDYSERTAKETEAWWMADQIETGEHLKGDSNA